MAYPKKRSGGLELEGLDETLTALKRLGPKYRPEAADILSDAARDVANRAQARIGRDGRYPKKRAMVGVARDSKGGAVRLESGRYPWALGAEFGEDVAHVYGRPWKQARFTARTMAPHSPPTSSDPRRNTGGYMIQPALRTRIPHWEREAERRVTDLFRRALR